VVEVDVEGSLPGEALLWGFYEDRYSSIRYYELYVPFENRDGWRGCRWKERGGESLRLKWKGVSFWERASESFYLENTLTFLRK